MLLLNTEMILKSMSHFILVNVLIVEKLYQN